MDSSEDKDIFESQDLSNEKNNIIYKQITKNICKIKSECKENFIGFFCNINFPDIFNILPALITDSNISIAVIDNSNSLDEDVLYNSDNQLKVSRNESTLDSLFNKRPNEYKDYILEKIDQIDLPVIIGAIEEEISASLNPSIKERTIKFFKTSTNYIKKVISINKTKKF